MSMGKVLTAPYQKVFVTIHLFHPQSMLDRIQQKASADRAAMAAAARNASSSSATATATATGGPSWDTPVVSTSASHAVIRGQV